MRTKLALTARAPGRQKKRLPAPPFTSHANSPFSIAHECHDASITLCQPSTTATFITSLKYGLKIPTSLVFLAKGNHFIAILEYNVDAILGKKSQKSKKNSRKLPDFEVPFRRISQDYLMMHLSLRWPHRNSHLISWQRNTDRHQYGMTLSRRWI
jgi:hypothetical protein